MEPRLVAVGALLLFVSSVVPLGTRGLGVQQPLSLVAATLFVVAAGTWAARRPERNEPA